MSKLTEIYTSILKFSGLDVDDKGYISTVLDDKRDPAFINGLRMVLPVDHHLRSFDPKEKIIFHPLTENILRGESEVIVKLKSVINIRLNFTVGIVAQSLLNLVASPELHHRLSPEQAELLTSITESDDKTVSNFISQMLSGMKHAPDRIFTNIYLKRGGTFNGKRYSRVGVVTFPFYQQVIENKVDKIRVKDKETFKQLFEFIFPDLNEQEQYNFGSDSHIAPYLEALMQSAANVASRLNDLLLLYKDFVEDAEKIMFDSEWVDYFKDMNALLVEIRKVPVQFGNDGVATISEEVNKQEVSVPTEYQPKPVQQYPVQQVYQTPAAPELRKTKRGLDFQSVIETNASVAMTPNPLAPQMAMQQWGQQQMAQPPMPSWAQPQQPQQQQMPQMGQVVNTPQGPAMMTPNGLMPALQMGNGQWVPASVAPNGQLVPMQMGNQQMMQPQQMQYPPQGGMAPTPTWANNGGYNYR